MNHIVSRISCMLALLACAGFAQNIVFPNVPGVIDVTKPPYNADNTGKTDVGAILTQALNDQRTSGNWAVSIVYLPNGTYLTKSTISWKLPPNTVGPHLYGQSRKGTVIKLADSTCRSSTQASYVVQTGGNVAQNFQRGFFNLTVDIGKGNPGAIGVLWYANNGGLMSDIDIISEDGLGVAGLRVGTVEEGPACARRIYIKGFNYGIWSSANLNTMTLSQISLEGQRLCGIVNEAGFPLYLDSLTSANSVTAVFNRSAAQMVLINAHCTGGRADTVAIVNAAGCMFFARNIVTQGYRQAITSASHTVAPPADATIDEWSSHGALSLFNSPPRSLNLPIKRPPMPEWEQDTGKWANILKYTTGRTDAAALQAAIDDPAKTAVILPKGRDFTLSGNVYVRGNIKMIIAVGAGLAGSGSLVVTDAAGSPPVVQLMKLTSLTGVASPNIVQQSGRTVVLESILLNQINYGIVHQGAGDLFGADILCPLQMTNAQAHAWMWHYNAELVNNQLNVSAGKAWIFGWKDEGQGTSVQQTGGAVELIGFYNYAYGDHTNTPEFLLAGGAFSVACATQCRYSSYYTILVDQTYNGTKKQFLSTANTTGFPTVYDMPLFTAYDQAMATERRVSGPAMPRVTIAEQTDRRMMSVAWDVAGVTHISLVNSSGRAVLEQACAPGTRRVGIDASEFPAGSYRIVLSAGAQRIARNLMIAR
jgi:hypothetical protein